MAAALRRPPAITRSTRWLLAVLIAGACTKLREPKSKETVASNGIEAAGRSGNGITVTVVDRGSGHGGSGAAGAGGSSSGVGNADGSDAGTRDSDRSGFGARDASVSLDSSVPLDASHSMPDARTSTATPDAGLAPGDAAPSEPRCLAATQACDQAAQCCDDLSCGTTTLGRVCCGLQRTPCATSNGEDCCANLACGVTTLGRVCCGQQGTPCSTTNGEDCCGSLSCDVTSLGRVCCGEQGAACKTANGEDCCRDLNCVNGHCTH